MLRVTSALLAGGGIPDDLYRAAEAVALGRAGLVELATLAATTSPWP